MSYDTIRVPLEGLSLSPLREGDGADSFYDVSETDRTFGEYGGNDNFKTPTLQAQESDIESTDLENTSVDSKTPRSTRRSTRKSPRLLRYSPHIEEFETSSPVLSPRVIGSEENQQLQKSAGRTPKRLSDIGNLPDLNGTFVLNEGEEDLKDVEAAGMKKEVETKGRKKARSSRTRRAHFAANVEQIEAPPSTPEVSLQGAESKENEDLQLRKSAGRTPKRIPKLVVTEAEVAENDIQEDENQEPRKLSVIPEEAEEEPPVFKTPTKKTPKKNTKTVCLDGTVLQRTPEKTHRMVTRQDVRLKTPTLESGERRALKRPFEPEAGPSNEMTFAEQIYHFQHDTPERFHVWKNVQPDLTAHQVHVTVPCSPALLTKTRARPTLLPTPEEREELEVKEMQKHQVKAHPVSEKVLHPQLPPRPQPRPSTIIRPFHFTEVGKKKTTPDEDKPFQFKARPMPANVYQINKKTPCEQMDKGMKPQKLGPYERSLQMLKMKEEKLAHLREEQNKVTHCQFHATPVPKFLARRSRESLLRSRISLHSRQCQYTPTSPERKRFKASRPSVLYRKPFEPMKIGKPLTEVTNFVLNTEERVRSREEHCKNVKEKNGLTEKEKEAMKRCEETDLS